MVSFAQLLLPLIAAAVLVFVASSLIHMVFKWHNPDYQKLGNEDEVMAAIRKGMSGGGQYAIPHCMDMKQMQTPEMQKKLEDGPTGFIVVRGPGKPGVGKPLALWFALTLLVSGVAGCILATTLGPGAARGQVLHIAGLISFAAFAVGSVSDAIWFARPWRAVGKDLLDAVIYAGIIGGTYAVLWPATAPAAIS